MPHFYPNLYVFRKLLKDIRGKKILDFGCGCGQFSYLLSSMGADVTAIDLSEKNIEDLKKLAKNRQVDILAQVASVDNCPFSDESFDIIFGSAILHHLDLDEERKACQEAFRLLKKGGRAIFIEPLQNAVWFKELIQYVPVRDKYNPRPSRLSPEYEKYLLEHHHPDRPLTSRHFIEVFRQSGYDVKVKEMGIFNRLDRLTRNFFMRRLICSLDYYVLQYLVPFRKKFCRNIVIMATK